MIDKRVAWLEHINITQQHMQLSEQYLTDKLFYIVKEFNKINKSVFNIDYTVHSDAIIIESCTAISASAEIFSLDCSVKVDFVDLESGVYDIHINCSNASGLNGAPGYKNCSHCMLAVTQQISDQFDPERLNDVTILRPRYQAFVTRVLSGINAFEDNESIAILRVKKTKIDVHLVEELYSLNTKAISFTQTLNSYKGVKFLEQIVTMIEDGIFSNYKEIYHDVAMQLYHEFSIKSNVKFTSKHAVGSTVNIMSQYRELAQQNMNINTEPKMFTADEYNILHFKIGSQMIDKGYILFCEFEPSTQAKLSISNSLMIHEYDYILSEYNSGGAGMDFTIISYKHLKNKIIAQISGDWNLIKHIAVKPLHGAIISRVWIE
jgi:hypothetical protein